MTTERDDVPAEITLPADTLAALMADPELMQVMEAARREGGTAGLVVFLDEHGLRWRAGGSDPHAAFADALEHGGVEFGSPFRDIITGGPEYWDAAGDRRKAARKAQRKARKTQRRR